MPDSTLSQAIKEAYASAPTNSIVYHTLEIYHANFTQPVRVVRDYVDLTATLESTAPRNPSASVLFVALPFDITPPEVNYAGVPQCTLEIDNISRELVANLELAMSSTDPITVIYRAFLSTDLTGPQNNPPMLLTIISVTADVFKIRATATFSDLVNKRFPSEVYNTTRFPGLGL